MAVEKSISNLIESQFPALYREEGPNFVQFVKSYYEWMEEANNSMSYARNFLEYHDIDTTIDSFLIHFKNKYINNMQFETSVQSRSLIKHSLDLYRSKGTERSIDLFFKSVFGTPAQVYYPGQDIFKTSAGEWVEPIYLEVEVFDNPADFIGVQIEGAISGATAFVDRFVKKKTIDSSYVTYILYINALIGDFMTGEKIKVSSTGQIGPAIIGSLNVLDVIDGAGGYAVGDLVYLDSDYTGKNGKALVTEVESVSGKTDFTLINGGWGYTANSLVLISENAFMVSNVDSPTYGNFLQFETAYQAIASLSYTGLTGNSIAQGDFIYKRSSLDGSIIATGLVINVSASNTTAGTLVVNEVEGHLSDVAGLTTEDGYEILLETAVPVELVGVSVDADGYLYKYDLLGGEDNNLLVYNDNSSIVLDPYTTRATLVSTTDATAVANIMLLSSNVTVTVSNVTTRFSNGESIYCVNSSAMQIGNGVITVASYSGTNGTIAIANTKGNFVIGGTLYSSNTAASGYVENFNERFGVITVNGDFTSVTGNVIRGMESGTTASIVRTSNGHGASFELASTLLYPEVNTFDVDVLSTYIDMLLSATDFGFPSPGIETINSIINDSLTFETDTFGKISSIIVKSNGEDYDGPPFVLVYEPVTAKYRKRDYFISVANTVGSFTVGEQIVMGGVGKGLIQADSNTTYLHVERTSFTEPDEIETIFTQAGDEILFENGDSLTTEQFFYPIIGELSGAVTYLVAFYDDPDSLYMGENAIIEANTTTANGSVVSLRVVDSGFNYFTGETVSFYSNTSSLVGRAEVTEMKQGKAQGYWKSNDSVLSGDKYLQDGEYYQEFSYEVQSSITLDRYADMLKNILHVAGTKSFSRFVSQESITSNADISEAAVTIE